MANESRDGDLSGLEQDPKQDQDPDQEEGLDHIQDQSREEEEEGPTSLNKTYRFRTGYGNAGSYVKRAKSSNMPLDIFELATNGRAAKTLQSRRRLKMMKQKSKFKMNTVISIYKQDVLTRVVMVENLPFMCTVCGETFAHTTTLREHAEMQHEYYQDQAGVLGESKKPVIIEREFDARKRRKSEIKFSNGSLPPGLKENKGLDNDLRNGSVDDDHPEPISSDKLMDNETSHTDISAEASKAVANISDLGSDGEDILLQMASTGGGTFSKKRKSTDENAAEETLTNVQDAKDKKKTKGKKRGRPAKFALVTRNASVVVAKKRRQEDENGEPRKVKVNRPYCCVCGIKCQTRVWYRGHLADVHMIFRNKEDALAARERLKEERALAGADVEAEEGVIQCKICETYVLDQVTLLKHQRSHCGMHNVKCDICKEAIVLWEAGRIEELRTLKEKFLSVDRRPEDQHLYVEDEEVEESGSGPLAGKKASNGHIVSSCYECGERFFIRPHMQLHHRKAHDTITCKDCNETVPTLKDLQRHSEKNHKPGILRCPYCPRAFHDFGKYNYHMSGHMGVFKCSGCGRRFQEKPSLLRHLKKYANQPEHFRNDNVVEREVSLDKPYVFDGVVDHRNRKTTPSQCFICQCAFTSQGNLTRHINLLHAGHPMLSACADTTFVCDQCGHIFWTRSHLSSHQRTHNKKLKCRFPGCNRRFHVQFKLNKHMESHSEGMNYICSTCNCAFKTADSLRLHIRTHNGDLYTCDDCQKEFISPSDLKYHKQDVHEKERNIECEVCSLMFTSRRRLLSHAKIHTDRQKTHVCEKCSAAFTERRLLTQHRRVHNKTHRCTLCTRSFSKASALQNHLDKAHQAGEVPDDAATMQSIQVTSDSLQDHTTFTVQEDEQGSVLIVELSADDLATKALAAIVSELQAEHSA